MRSLLPSLRVVFLLPLSFVACTPATPAPKAAAGTAAAVAAPRVPTDELHWLRDSAEYRAITIQTYRAALEAAAKASAGRPAGSWAISVDADETVLDNSTYEVELQRQGLVHTDAAWKSWVKRGERAAVPGAAAFLAGVQKLGGRVAVSDEHGAVALSRRAANLPRRRAPSDLLVCRAEDGEDRKEGRWRGVADGTARPDLGPAEILIWVGDNIQDFPDQSQELRSSRVRFRRLRRRYFALPDPIYTAPGEEPAR
ncbi:MAG: hypothetical protein IPP07_30445 [Holophagales bacterium]|nr:hypothetical protein [Holophagales bacterium]